MKGMILPIMYGYQIQSLSFHPMFNLVRATDFNTNGLSSVPGSVTHKVLMVLSASRVFCLLTLLQATPQK